MNWERFFTLVLALYGAALSTVVFLLQRRDLKPRIRVELRHGALEVDGTRGPLTLFLEAINGSHSAATLSAAGVSFAAGDDVYLSQINPNPLPVTLAPGRSYDYWIAMDQFRAEVAKRGLLGAITVRFFFTDEVHHVYWSDRFELNIDEPNIAIHPSA